MDIGECAEAARSSMSDEWKVWAQNCIKTEPPGRRLLTLAKFRIQAPVEFGSCGDCYKKAARGKSQTHSEGLRKQKKTWPWHSDVVANNNHKAGGQWLSLFFHATKFGYQMKTQESDIRVITWRIREEKKALSTLIFSVPFSKGDQDFSLPCLTTSYPSFFN